MISTLASQTQSVPAHDDVALQLPWERLKTPDTPFRPARVAPDRTVKLLRRAETDARERRLNLAVASSGALFYRYSGQADIPLVLRLAGMGDASCRMVTIPVTGATTAAELMSRANSAVGNAKPATGAVPPLVVDVAFGQRSRAHVPDTIGREADVTLELTFVGDSLTVSLLYNESLLAAGTAARLLEHFSLIAEQLDGEGAAPVRELRLHTPAELAWLARHGRGPVVHFRPTRVHDEVAAHARNTPHKAAVRFNGAELSYAELDRRANRLASYLHRSGVTDGKAVIVCLEPSFHIAVALLGILKAGAAYVPVNPLHPEFRTRAIVEDTRPELILTSTRSARAVEGFDIARINLDDPPASFTNEPAVAPRVHIRPEQLAYVYYTSGSTGQPKGVAGTHANLSHIVNVSRLRYAIDANDVIPAVAAFTFSISLFELTAALSVGGTLLVLEREHVLDLARMTATLREVTLFHIGPSLLKSLVRYIRENVSDPDSEFQRVRHASSGGDMVPPELLRELREIFTAAELYVIYGSSEIALMGCTWDCSSERVERTLVGKPFANVHLLVLDDDGNRVPVGVAGDVCFGGPGVVAGYVNRKLQANLRFVEKDGTRWYHMGDRGRLTESGDLELLGRRDFQLKLRGMRIELAEVDYHLRQAPGVREAVAAAHAHQRGEAVLVGWYVPDDSGRANPETLRAHMVSRLPDYMVPAFYVALDELPLNHNLKIDRRRLPQPSFAAPATANPPVNETEKAVARIWRDLLKVERVSLDDNFMLLGGDSLLAMEMIFLVERELGYRLDGMDVLRESLWILAHRIDEHAGKAEPAAGAAMTREIWPVSTFYFGSGDSLYGVYSPARAESTSPPVLICPPLGFEYTRCHFLLRNLMERLADAGIPSLRFDFFGSADSLGSDLEGGPARWRTDLLAAAEELRQRAGVAHIRLFAMRLASALALQALPADLVDRWVFWDPLTDGAPWYRELLRMSQEKAQKLMLKRNLRKPRPIPGGEELVGTRYSDAAIADLQALRLHRSDLPEAADIRLVLSPDYAGAYREALDVFDGFPQAITGTAATWSQASRVTVAITAKDILERLGEALQGSGR